MAEISQQQLLNFIYEDTGSVPPPTEPDKFLDEEDEYNNSDMENKMLNFITGGNNNVSEKKDSSIIETIAEAEQIPNTIEYHMKMGIPLMDEVDYLSSEEHKRNLGIIEEQQDMSATDKTREEFDSLIGHLEKLSPEEKAKEAEKLKRSMLGLDEEGEYVLQTGVLRRAGVIEQIMAESDPVKLMQFAKGVSLVGAYTDDSITEGLSILREYTPVLYDGINKAMTGFGRYSEADTPRELSGTILESFGSVAEFAETVPVLGGLFAKRTAVSNLRRAGKKALREAKRLETARRYNPDGATIATMEAAEETRIAAKQVADNEVELSNQMIVEFETKIGGRDVDGTIIDDSKIISTETNGVLKVDPDKSREVGRQTAFEITERDGALFDLALGEDIVTSPILNPDKFNGFVAAAKELKELKPDAFNNKKTVIDNLLDLSISKDFEADIGGQNLIDILNKYGLSFEDYVLTVVGSGSDAGKVLNALSQIKRKKPQSIIDADKAAAKVREAGDLRRGVMRVENVRRGGLVSQIATAARNLTSAAIRAPMESLGNVMDTAIYTAQNKGIVAGIGSLLSRDNWSGSFSNMKYMFSRPDVAKGYSDLILERPELAKQFDAMYNNINEIQKLTGRGSGGRLDRVLSEMEDVVDVLNTPNRWQEFLIRRGQFFGELERLTKRHYDIDLIDALNEGKLKDLMNDASSVKPEKAPSFITLVDEATTKALDVTYAKQPEIPIFREMSAFITRNGLTVLVEFPRFMFNSMELMGQYAAGSSIPLTRKVKDLVTLSNSGPLTSKDRQRISRNLMGMAAVGAGYWYRTSEEAPPEYNQVAVGSEAQMNTTPTYPMAHFLYLGEATKRLKEGTFDDWFDGQEFVELFTGSNFRTGVGNSILEEVAQIADATDLTAEETVGRAAGRALGNYLTTWVVPFAQIIDSQRALDIRGTEYKDVAKDPTLDGVAAFGNEIKRSFQQRGFGLSAEEEAALPIKEYPFYPDGKERLSPAFKLAGVSLTSRPSNEGEYLMSLGFDYRQFGSKSKVPTIQRYEQRLINGHMGTLVEIAQSYETILRQEYQEANETLREEFTEEEYVANKLRPLISEELTSFKREVRDIVETEGSPYARAMITYRRIQPQFRKLATTDFVERYGRNPDPSSTEDLQVLTEIAQIYKEAY